MVDQLFERHRDLPAGEKSVRWEPPCRTAGSAWPADLTGAAAFLAAADADYLVGEALNVAGGNRLN